jgi:hypothetical protein
MPRGPVNGDEVIEFALTTARKIETEARKNPQDLRRLVLLSNTYDACASRVAKTPLPSLPYSESNELFPLDEDLVPAKQPLLEVPSFSAIDGTSAIDDSFSSSDSSDESDSDSDSEEEAPPPYTSQPDPSEVIIIASEYWSRPDPDDNSTLLHHLAVRFDTFDSHNTEKSNSSGPKFIEDVEEMPCIQSGKGTAEDCLRVPLVRSRSASREPRPRRAPLLRERVDCC